MGLSVVVLAAGEGKRFKSSVAKPLHQAAGRPLLWHVLRAASGLDAERTVVVVGDDAEDMRTAVSAFGLGAVGFAVQSQQSGTGDALACALPSLPGDGDVLVLYGDTPLLERATLARLVATHASERATASLLTFAPADPTGYGRIVRDAGGQVERIVEERDASPQERAIGEANAGVYVFRRTLLDDLARLRTDNDQGERYLPDLVEVARSEGGRVAAERVDAMEVMGVNDRAQLAEAAAALRRRVLERLMADGVTIVDPAATYVDVDVEVAADTTLLPFCYLEAGTAIGPGCTIGPNARLIACTVAEDATVTQAVCMQARIGPRAQVGPFAFLRPGAELGPDSKVGTYVEIKQSRVGARSKVPHLSYVGDAEIGEDVNVGAGTVFVNYDGFSKHRSKVGNGAFIGSDSMLVGPVTIGEGAMTAAGSTISKDVPADAIAIERSEQRVIEGAAARRRARLRRGSGGQAHGDHGAGAS